MTTKAKRAKDRDAPSVALIKLALKVAPSARKALTYAGSNLFREPQLSCTPYSAALGEGLWPGALASELSGRNTYSTWQADRSFSL